MMEISWPQGGEDTTRGEWKMPNELPVLSTPLQFREFSKKVHAAEFANILPN